MNTEQTIEQTPAIQTDMSWIDKLTRRQKRIVFKADKYSDRVKKLLMK